MQLTPAGRAPSGRRDFLLSAQFAAPRTRPPEPARADRLWAYEVKFDANRFICRRDGDRVRVFSRHGRDWTERVPRIAEALATLPVSSATIDG